MGYVAANQMSYLQRRRQRAKEHLGGRCVVCGTDADLEFDHIEPSTKVINISNAIVAHWSWERLLTELIKCQLLCAEHHRAKTKAEGDNTGGGRNRITHRPHGGGLRYGDGCRCTTCRRWRNDYRSGRVDYFGNEQVLLEA